MEHQLAVIRVLFVSLTLNILKYTTWIEFHLQSSVGSSHLHVGFVLFCFSVHTCSIFTSKVSYEMQEQC